MIDRVDGKLCIGVYNQSFSHDSGRWRRCKTPGWLQWSNIDCIDVAIVLFDGGI
jgi:hypothetical protein